MTTTLREFGKKFHNWLLTEISHTHYPPTEKEIDDFTEKFLTSHNTELIKKIEGLGEVFMVISGVDDAVKSDVPLVSKRAVINLINQE